MSSIPNVSAGDWVYVGTVRCVVRKVYKPDSTNGVCQVVFNKDKPTTHDVDWDGDKWFFPKRPDFGGYARQSDPFVQQLLGKR